MDESDGLPPEIFELFLARLHPDREQAGEAYEILRAQLIHFFQFKRCHKAEECADETINRVARRIANGEPVEKIPAYAHGVARYVLLEYLRQPDRNTVELDPTLPTREDLLTRVLADEQARCLKQCLRKLGEQDAGIFIQYYLHDETSNSDARQNLARDLDITPRALRLRVFRIRGRLETCYQECLGTKKKR